MAEQAKPAALIIFGGRPGVGKTTIATALASRTGGFHLRIDSIESALKSASPQVEASDAGYRAAYAVARDNLSDGRIVIADSVNPLAITRKAWRDVASTAGAHALQVEIVCSNPGEHQRRVEARQSDIDGLVVPNWQTVQSRRYERWPDPDLVLDTATMPSDDCATLICERLESVTRAPHG